MSKTPLLQPNNLYHLSLLITTVMVVVILIVTLLSVISVFSPPQLTSQGVDPQVKAVQDALDKLNYQVISIDNPKTP